MTTLRHNTKIIVSLIEFEIQSMKPTTGQEYIVACSYRPIQVVSLLDKSLNTVIFVLWDSMKTDTTQFGPIIDCSIHAYFS